MTAGCIQIADLGKSYGRTLALAEVNLTLAPGRLHALVGENGAGKSTLLHILAGLLKPTSGTCTVDGQHVYSGDVAVSLGVGLLAQEISLVPELSIEQNFALAGSGWVGLKSAVLRSQVRDSLARLGLEQQPDSSVATLDVSTAQNVELARLLWTGRQILLLDEPTAKLSPSQATRLFKILRALVDDGLTVVYSSHQLQDVLAWADEIHVLRKGKLQLSATREHLAEDQLLAAMFGTVTKNQQQAVISPQRIEQPVLDIRGLTCQGWEGRVLDLVVGAGEAVGIVGLANQGQEELVATISGLCPAVAGTVRIAGRMANEDLEPLKPNSSGLGCLPNDLVALTAMLSMCVDENLVLHEHRHLPFVRWWGSSIDWSAIKDWGTVVITTENLAVADAGCQLAWLSAGNQRKLLMARELHRAKVALIAHNIMTGLDLNATRSLVRRLVAAKADGIGLLLLDDDFDFLEQIVDRVLLIKDGTLIATDQVSWRDQVLRRMGG